MALIDLRFSTQKNQRLYDCSKCPKPQQEKMKCQEEGFNQLKRSKKVDDYGVGFNFCPGKAQWFPEILDLFLQCRLALEAGIMPVEGHFQDQPELFVDVFPVFLDRWNERKYVRVWNDVEKFSVEWTEAFLKAIAKMLTGKK